MTLTTIQKTLQTPGIKSKRVMNTANNANLKVQKRNWLLQEEEEVLI